MKILVADDHKLIVEDIVDELHGIVPDAEIIGTNEPDQILRLADEHLFDVIFMDIDLDQENGIDLAEQILEKHPRTNIIYVTSYEKFAIDSYRTRASAFLLKPVTTERLRDAMDHLLHPISPITDEILHSAYAGGGIGARILRQREECGLSRSQFALEMNCAVQTVHRWENGERIPDVPTLMKIAKVLGVSLNDLTQ